MDANFEDDNEHAKIEAINININKKGCSLQIMVQLTNKVLMEATAPATTTATMATTMGCSDSYLIFCIS